MQVPITMMAAVVGRKRGKVTGVAGRKAAISSEYARRKMLSVTKGRVTMKKGMPAAPAGSQIIAFETEVGGNEHAENGKDAGEEQADSRVGCAEGLELEREDAGG